MDPEQSTFEAEFEGCIYADQPSNPKYKLTAAQLRAMRYEGLPIRIEHDLEHDVGRVLGATVTPDGRAYVRAALFNNHAGWAAHQLIREKDLRQLSLKHGIHEDGKVEAIEVSLVQEGARPRTDIYVEEIGASGSAGYLGSAATNVVAASAEMEPAAAAVAAQPQAPASEQLAPPQQPAAAQPAAQPSASPDEQAAKRARGEDGRFAPSGGAAQPAALPAVLESIAGAVKDPEQVKALYGSVAGLLQQMEAQEKELGVARGERSALEALLKEQQSKTASITKDQTEQIVRTLKSVYQKMLNHKLGDESAAALEKALVDPALTAALHPMVVCASKWEEATALGAKARADDELLAAKAQIGNLYSKLGLVGSMGGQTAAAAPVAPAVVPSWTPVQAHAPAYAAPPAAPLVTVAASAPTSIFEANPALAGMRSYVETMHDSRVYGSNFTRAVPVAK